MVCSIRNRRSSRETRIGFGIGMGRAATPGAIRDFVAARIGTALGCINGVMPAAMASIAARPISNGRALREDDRAFRARAMRSSSAAVGCRNAIWRRDASTSLNSSWP